MTILWPPFVGWMFFCSLLFRILSRTRVNRYIHFGDFDLAGICIYQSEFYKFLGDRAGFLIPEDIEERLKSGNAGLYDTQYLRYKNLNIIDSRLNGLVEMIHHYGRVYEQEGYIENCAY